MTTSQDTERYFSSTYAEARERFLSAARRHTDRIDSYPVDATGAQGEALSTDVAMIAPPNARRLLILTSATHGAEGHCGSGCQVALLDDAPMLARAAEAGVALLLIHAVNPYGFSWGSRTNEDNIDLNRNAQAFGAQPLPVNADYGDVHDWLVPSEWPPTPQNERAIAEYIERHGVQRFRNAVSSGQYTHASGLFYGGQAQSRSLQTVSHVLRTQAASFADIGWIDYHTGLGPQGHGEKIFAGQRNEQEVDRARQWWGADIAVPFAGTSASVDVTGQLASTIYTCCPESRPTLMAMEYGTQPFEAVVGALRGEAWLRAHPDAPTDVATALRRRVRDAFYCDHDVWKGMVLGQSRVAVLQALCGLSTT
ncbi:M14 family metallopeptidase [Pandoraea commovens]|uniref:M14 family metallopeptidase n=1 Tax=Pandoraea commovens TaxID=2508289 RepID=A0ABY5QH02_9BURK|nr:M14 family metallopeptidase [Pandoraea commovens]UVA80091.1 M14 family metallopeptidase [Pandoraea commovens]